MTNECLYDVELLAGLKSGNQEAFTHIYRKYWQGLYNAAFKRVKNKEQCQDIVQSVFTSLWDRRGEVNINNISAYLHTAVKFQVFKQAARSPNTTEFLEAFEHIITSPVNTDDAILEKEILLMIKLWIDALPDKRRKIFLMHYNDDLSTAEIAGRLNISRKTVQNQLNTASQALRLRLVQLLSLLILSSFISR